MRNYNHNILKTEYDKNTGVIIDQVKFKNISKSKGGWKRMYKDYTTAMEECINGKIDLKIWNMLVNSTKADFSLSVNITSLSRKVGASRTTIHLLVKRMIENNVIRKIDDYYEFNPFIYCPYGASDEMIYNKQEEWKLFLK